MRSNYRKIGEFIREVDNRNSDLKVSELRGLSMTKEFRESTSNIVGTDMSVYKVMYKWQFACDFMSPIRVNKLPVVLKMDDKPNLVSPAYPVFEVIDRTKLDPEYLMMWFRRPEFDRYATFKCDSAIRGGYNWEELCDTDIPVPHIDKQRELVKEYNTIVNRINLNNQLIQKLEETAQAIYKQWFVEKHKNSESNLVAVKNYLQTNPSLSLKKNTIAKYVEMNDITNHSMSITGSIEREYNGGSKFQNGDTLFARITPCLENGKTAFVDIMNEKEIGFGSTEFIVLRAKDGTSPYWVYCLARDDNFRSYAISSMIGSSGRERVHEKYLEYFQVYEIQNEEMKEFHSLVSPLFEKCRRIAVEVKYLLGINKLILSKIATI